ncbi:MAG: hypothetical protein MZV63_00005 [Marinilabiliales bacterium]|nr:hypothetical protein [Marinilabiliales bacterium]
MEKNGFIYHLFVKKTGEFKESVKAEEFCSIENAKLSDGVISFSKGQTRRWSRRAGNNSQAKAFINTLPEIDA